MRFVLIFSAQVLRWMAVLVSITVFVNSQNVPSTARSGNQFYKVQSSTGQVVSDTFVGTHLQGAVTLVPALAAALQNLPEGLQYFKFNGGKYSRFVVTGPYSNLPEASGRVFQIVAEQKIGVRDDFNIENYVNDPRTTPEDQLITEILIPTV